MRNRIGLGVSMGLGVIFLSMLTFSRAKSSETVTSRLNQYGPSVDSRLAPVFKKAGVSYPPYKLGILAFKDTKKMEIYAKSKESESYKFITSYDILKASGKPGPKLREGDLQVPEGIYRIEFLNPNSKYHLSMRLNYPNSFDRDMAKKDGRTTLGGDIMIHGKAVSIGCLAMGDTVAENLFVLCAKTGLKNIKVVISPVDFRAKSNFKIPDNPKWLPKLYQEIKQNLREF